MHWMHRDIKPENILLDADGNVVLSDFGLAYDFSSGVLPTDTVGTLGYRSPQAHKGVPYSAKTGICSLGCVLQVVLHGEVSTLEACSAFAVLIQPPSASIRTHHRPIQELECQQPHPPSNCIHTSRSRTANGLVDADAGEGRRKPAVARGTEATQVLRVHVRFI